MPLSVMGGGCKRLETQVHFQGWLTSFSIRAAEEKASVRFRGKGSVVFQSNVKLQDMVPQSEYQRKR